VKSEMIPVVLYGRISLDRRNETSTETQVREMTQLCELNGYQVVGTFIDFGKSAFKLDTDRPEFDEAMRMIESGGATKLIVWKLDRMTRNARGFMKINERLEEVGATFQSVKEPWFDTSSPIGFALVFLMAALAQIEAENIQTRIKGWHETRRLNGNVPVGPRPYGYRRPKPGDEDWVDGGSLHVIPKEAAILKECAERVLGGDDLRAIARDFDARGIPTAKGNGRGWNHTSIRQFLMNPTVAGMFKDGERASTWKPILTVDQWTELQTLLNDPSRDCLAEKRTKGRKYVLGSLMTCSRCQGPMTTKVHKKGHQYHCKGCSLSIMGKVADREVTSWVLSNVTEAKWSSLRTQGKGHDPKVVDGIMARIDKLDMMMIDGTITPERYDRMNSELQSQLAATIDAPSIKLPDIANLHEGWEAMSVSDKRMVIEAVIGSIEVFPHAAACTGSDRIRIEPK
jgi:site-specific DNA recombinase